MDRPESFADVLAHINLTQEEFDNVVLHFDLAPGELENFLEHYGVKGMKWGVRRPRGSDGTVVGPPPGASDEAKAASATKAKINAGGAKAASNAEIRQLVERMNLEQQYSRLNPPKKGVKDYAKDLLVKQADKSVKTLADTIVSQELAKAMGKKGYPVKGRDENGKPQGKKNSGGGNNS